MEGVSGSNCNRIQLYPVAPGMLWHGSGYNVPVSGYTWHEKLKLPGCNVPVSGDSLAWLSHGFLLYPDTAA